MPKAMELTLSPLFPYEVKLSHTVYITPKICKTENCENIFTQDGNRQYCTLCKNTRKHKTTHDCYLKRKLREKLKWIPKGMELRDIEV